MAKTLNQFLEGYLKVKNPDEQKFVDKHVVAKHADRNGNDDDAFKGKTKQIDRRKERHGYNPGEDEKVYEELKGNQHKIDANKNGKVDAYDFKLLRAKKKMKEEAEQVDERWSENSKKTSKNLAAAALDVGNVATGGLLSKSKLAKKAMKWADSPDETTSKSSLKAYQARQARKTNEEAEQIDELSNRMLKSYAKKANKQGVKIASTGVSKAPGNEHLARKLANRQDGEDLARTKLAVRREEAEQIDELSTPTLQSYRKKARAQGNAIVDKMKMGGGDWSKDQKDTKTLRKRAAGAQASGKQLVKRGESLKTEEVEELDELSRDTLRRYRMKSKSIGDNEKGDIGYRSKGRDLAARKTHGGQWGIPKAKVMASEEAEPIEELSKATLGSYAKKAKDQMSRSDTIAGREMGSRYDGQRPSPMERKHNQRADKRYRGLDMAISKLAKEEAEQVDEVLTAKTPMGTYIKDFQKSDAPQFKGKSKEKRRVMAIAAKLTAERGGKPLRKEEKLANLLGDLTESHRRTMLSVFDKLNEDNQKKFLAACQTPEGVESMLDFAISHRGE